MKLESGPAAYDRNYYLMFLILCIALGGYFYYDYAIGYLNKNREKAREVLTPLMGGAENIPETFPASPTKPEFEALFESKPTDPQAIYDKLGQPLVKKPTEDGKTINYFVSDYGMVRLAVVGGQIDPKTSIVWTPWYKSKEEIRLQLYCALICFAVALYVLTRVFRAATLRAVIDDEGMTYGGRRILFENMTRLCDYSKKGWVDLYHKLGAEERKLRIDNQKIRKFDEIINTICEVKGFEDPRKIADQS